MNGCPGCDGMRVEVATLTRERDEAKRSERHWFDRASKAMEEASERLFPRVVEAERERDEARASLVTVREQLATWKCRSTCAVRNHEGRSCSKLERHFYHSCRCAECLAAPSPGGGATP